MGVIRGRALLRALTGAVLVLGVLRAVAAVVSRQGTVGDEESDVFSIAAVCSGAARTSRASALRRGHVLATCGGVKLDLREASLDPGGAELLLRAYFGGIQVVVPEAWRVDLTADTTAGGADARVTEGTMLPAGAPSLRVEARAVLGGVQVTTQADGDEGPPAGASAAA
jgi:hypothetical protein